MCLCAVGCIVYDCLLFVDPLLLPEHLEVCEDSLYRLPPADEVRVAGVHICLLDRCKICKHCHTAEWLRLASMTRVLS